MSQVLFLLTGLFGIPVFAMGGGPGYVLQPSFGYLLGFPLGAWLIGTITERTSDSERWRSLLLANGLGFLVIHITGVAYLWMNINYIVHKTLSWNQAIWTGVIIFLPGEILKIFFASVLVRRLKPLMHGL